MVERFKLLLCLPVDQIELDTSCTRIGSALILLFQVGQFLFISTRLHHALHPETYLFPLDSTMHYIQKLIYFHQTPPCIAFRNLFISTRLHHALHPDTYLFPLDSTRHCIQKLIYFHQTPPCIAFRNLFISTRLHHALHPETYLFPLHSTIHCIQKLIDKKRIVC